MWVAVILLASSLEGLGKAIGRPRPAAHSPGFPTGHTSAAAAFYPMAAYFVAGAVSSRWAKRGLYAVAVVVIGLVAFSRTRLAEVRLRALTLRYRSVRGCSSR